ncbi:hypothetical protein V495_05588 [Pseudogymnoascus sp. VKM F-4514 (FW-929)]|nr:hypothetical protein V495_05588 [Pseudogymnoascus sp. VKM F-4514 (FW-929)]KFY65492.1 hypothetical protein V497_01383 [Pseudogymnoascus sp. VKM F-4516 (FW-969)]
MCKRIILIFPCGCRKPSTVKTCGYVGQQGHKIVDIGRTKRRSRDCNECFATEECGSEDWEVEEEVEEEEEDEEAWEAEEEEEDEEA